MKQKIAKIVWMGVLLSIPILSIFGRSLQLFLRERLSSDHLSVIFASTSFVLIGFLVIVYKEKPKIDLMIHLAWAVVLFALVPLFLSTVEERVHFIVFGLFGFCTLLLFRLPMAVVICLLVGGLDEILQWYLPDRVGDLRDVGFNSLAGIGGCLLAFFLSQEKATFFPKE